MAKTFISLCQDKGVNNEKYTFSFDGEQQIISIKEIDPWGNTDAHILFEGKIGVEKFGEFVDTLIRLRSLVNVTQTVNKTLEEECPQ